MVVYIERSQVEYREQNIKGTKEHADLRFHLSSGRINNSTDFLLNLGSFDLCFSFFLKFSP
jgi:hypothetical protein